MLFGCSRPERQADTAQDDSTASDAEQEAACAAIQAVVDELVGTPTKEEVTAALRAQLEQGNVVSEGCHISGVGSRFSGFKS